MKRYACVLLCSLSLLGCSATPTHDNFAKTMDSWVGKSLDKYVDMKGYPDGSMTAPNGNQVYYYNQSWAHRSSGMAVRSGSMLLSSPSQTYVQRCDTFLEVNEQRLILKWSSKGECVRYDVVLAE